MASLPASANRLKSAAKRPLANYQKANPAWDMNPCRVYCLRWSFISLWDFLRWANPLKTWIPDKWKALARKNPAGVKQKANRVVVVLTLQDKRAMRNPNPKKDNMPVEAQPFKVTGSSFRMGELAHRMTKPAISRMGLSINMAIPKKI